MLGQEESHVDTTSYGTASYAAPELLTQGKLTKAADIYSLGIISESVRTGLLRRWQCCCRRPLPAAAGAAGRGA